MSPFLAWFVLTVAALLLSSPVMAEPGGRGGGGGHGGGGWSGGGGGGHGGGGGGGGGGGVRETSGHSPSSGSSHANSQYRSAAGRPNASHPNASHPSGGHLGGGHPSGGYPSRPMYAHQPHPYYAHWYRGDWHDHWSHPWYYGPSAWFAVGFVAGVAVVDAPWHWGYWSYYNPYHTEVIVVDHVVIDYSRPIILASPPPAQPGSMAAPTASQAGSEAAQLLDQSRAAFAKGNYSEAMRLVNQAIAKKPNDPVPHEFRALILFATHEYSAATATIYAVLSIGPGWDWATLSSFYPDPNLYTTQLRALEQYCNENPNSPEVRFLLAYHYMSCGYNEQAATQLKEVVRLNPKDQLAAQLSAGLSEGKSGETAAPSQPSAPASPVRAEQLVGNWEANRPDGGSVALDVTSDAAYHWRHTQNGKLQEFSGAYTIADNLLILKNNGTAAMIGQITMLNANRFNFKMVGTPQSDPGLTFSKK